MYHTQAVTICTWYIYIYWSHRMTTSTPYIHNHSITHIYTPVLVRITSSFTTSPQKDAASKSSVQKQMHLSIVQDSLKNTIVSTQSKVIVKFHPLWISLCCIWVKLSSLSKPLADLLKQGFMGMNYDQQRGQVFS